MGCTEDKKSETKKIENLPDKSQWVIFNIQLAGLYKIKYDRNNYKLIVKTLNSKEFDSIHVINRAQLIDDAMDLAWTGEQDYGIALAMINYLVRRYTIILLPRRIRNPKFCKNNKSLSYLIRCRLFLFGGLKESKVNSLDIFSKKEPSKH